MSRKQGWPGVWQMASSSARHPGEGRDPGKHCWIPAFAGKTVVARDSGLRRNDGARRDVRQFRRCYAACQKVLKLRFSPEAAGTLLSAVLGLIALVEIVAPA